MADNKQKDFSFVKNRQPRKNAPIEENMFVWQHELAGKDMVEENVTQKEIRDRLVNRGVFII